MKKGLFTIALALAFSASAYGLTVQTANAPLKTRFELLEPLLGADNVRITIEDVDKNGLPHTKIEVQWELEDGGVYIIGVQVRLPKSVIFSNAKVIDDVIQTDTYYERSWVTIIRPSDSEKKLTMNKIELLFTR